MEQKKRTLRDAVREAAEKPKVQPVVPVPPKTMVGSTEQVPALCGHAVTFDLGPEKHRVERRKKITDKACQDCRLKAQAEREAKDRAAAEDRRRRNIGRLPDKSVFGPHTFDAASLSWTGTLTVPLGAGEVVVFTATASGILPLHSKLDKLYRASLLKEPPSNL